MFLQSIDNDGDESNGITITTNATNTANGLARSMITRTQAKNTFRNNLLFLYSGKYEGTFNGDDTGSWGATVDANGVISGISTSTTYGPDTIAGNLSSSGKSSMSGAAGKKPPLP